MAASFRFASFPSARTRHGPEASQKAMPNVMPGKAFTMISYKSSFDIRYSLHCLSGLCRPYGAKTIGVSLYPPLTQWATVVTPRWGVFVRFSLDFDDNFHVYIAKTYR